MKHVLLVTNVPNPYRVPLFNELDKQLKSESIQLKVLFGARGHRRRKWEVDMSQCSFDYEILSSKVLELFGDIEKTFFTYGGLLRRVRCLNPDVVIVAGFSLATVKLWLRGWIEFGPYIIWTGSLSRRGSSWFRTMQRKALVRRASGFIAYGTNARNYLIELGANPKDISIGINTVDTQFFAEESNRYRDKATVNDQPKRLLTIGYLHARKNNLSLLKAVHQMAKIRDDFVLDVVGDGTEREGLERFVTAHKLDRQVVFHGYKQRNELPRFLARSTCFLFPTNHDVWGLVVVEAMAAGLPVIASSKAGAVTDLVQDGVTGFVTDFDETDSVVRTINWILDNPLQAKTIGNNASAFISEKTSVEKSALGFVEAVRKVLGRDISGGYAVGRSLGQYIT